MLLIGYYDSPYVRRVAVTMKIQGIAFEHRSYATVADRAVIEAFNPLGRIPALVLDDGEILVESTIIIDHLDELAGPDRALTPPSGQGRRAVNRIVALALGTTDKYIAAYYETDRRPATHVWKPWLERMEQQVAAGLQALDGLVEGSRFFGERVTQADVTTVCAVESIRFDMLHLAPAERFPALDALVASVADMEAFASTRPG